MARWPSVVAALKEGNRRYKDAEPIQRPAAFSAHTGGQQPAAAILSCADSRVPAELIFNQGVGDLFVVRVAGNIATTTQIGSLEFAVAILQCSVIVVLGHTECGAVAAALGSDDSEIPAHLLPILTDVRSGLGEVSNMHDAIRSNVRHTCAELLRHSAVLQAAVESDSLGIVGAIYDLSNGNVEFLD